MFKFFRDCTFENPSSFNWIGLAALGISLLSILFSFHSIFLTKRIELISNKFQRFCLQNLDQVFTTLDAKFNDGTLLISEILNDVSQCSSDISLFLASINLLYDNINLDELTLFSDSFTDKIFEPKNNDALATQLKLDYLVFKLGLYSKLYDFALKKELNPLYRMIQLFKKKL